MSFVIFKSFFLFFNFLFWWQTKSVGNSYLQVCYFVCLFVFLCVFCEFVFIKTVLIFVCVFCIVFCSFCCLIYQRKLLRLAHWKCPFCGIPHLVFTRGRASIVMARSIGVVKHQQGQKQHRKYRSPMHLGPQSQQGELWNISASSHELLFIRVHLH